MRYSLLLLISMACVAWSMAEEMYSDKYDYIDVDEVLANERLREQYYKCFMGDGPCTTPAAVYFKEHVGEAFLTKCSKCTEKQKINYDKVAEWYTKNQPEKWEAFVAKVMSDLKEKAGS